MSVSSNAVSATPDNSEYDMISHRIRQTTLSIMRHYGIVPAFCFYTACPIPFQHKTGSANQVNSTSLVALKHYNWQSLIDP